MRIFIDTNVLVDLLHEQRPAHQASKLIFRAAEDRRLELMLTGLTLVNALYSVRKAGLDKRQLRTVVAEVLSVAMVASTDMAQLQAALVSDWPDYEDAVQYHAALSVGRVEAIVTSDANGFKGSRIEVLTPEQYIAKYL